MRIFETYKDFYHFVMHYEGRLVIRRNEVYEDGVLIGKMK